MGSNGNEKRTMVERPGWNGAVAQSLKVAAVVMVLGWAILAGEQRLTQDVSPEAIAAAETAFVFVAANGQAAEPITAQAAGQAQTASR